MVQHAELMTTSTQQISDMIDSSNAQMAPKTEKQDEQNYDGCTIL